MTTASPTQGTPVPQSTAYPDRRFQIWEYRVSHGSLLIRSPKSPHVDRNVDLVFVGVEYLAVPRILRGIVLERGSAEDRMRLADVGQDADPERLYILVSEGSRHPIVAVACRVDEHDRDIFDSPF